jgi:hypothetical protein
MPSMYSIDIPQRDEKMGGFPEKAMSTRVENIQNSKNINGGCINI